MKKFLDTSRSDFIATTALLLILILVFGFYFFYEKRNKEVIDFTAFEATVDEFYAQQQQYADSVAQARADRDAYYNNRYKRQKKRPQGYSYERDYKTDYQRDTSELKPLPKKKGYDIAKVDLNRCDTSDITRVPQFGSKRALKIVEYRDKLGGFHSLEQLHEIYILQNVNLAYCEKYFYANAQSIKKIHINTATYKEMIAHPYFDAYLTKTILQHRQKNGKIRNADEFQKITHAYADLMEKLLPYLSFD